MAKAKPNLAGVLDDLPAPPPAELPVGSRARRNATSVAEKGTVLVGANLPPRYACNLAYLHAETGRSKKELLQEALDMFFTSKGGTGVKI